MFHRLARVNLRRLSRDDALRRLGLEDGEFTSTQLKNAYLEKAKEFHPDSNKTEADRFHAIKEAYDFLQIESNPLYDWHFSRNLKQSNEEPAIDVKQEKRDQQYQAYLEQDDKLRENYEKWKAKRLAAGAREEDLLTEEQYISQARGVQASMMKSLLRLSVPITLIVAYLWIKK